MKSTLLSELYRIIEKDDLTLAYSGDFKDSLTDRIIELAYTYLESKSELSKLRRKTSFLVAECFQNVIRHGSKVAELIFDSPGRVESFVIRFYNSKCLILSENAIRNEHVEELRVMLENVNNNDKDELRDLYRHLLKEGELSEKGGAGLGLIEMARKSDNKLIYSFTPLEGDHTVFHLMLALENEAEKSKEPDYSEDFKQIEEIIKDLKHENHFLIYHGDFDSEIINPVSEMIERNLDAQVRPLAIKVKYYHAATKIMQQINTLSTEKGNKNSSMLSLGITDDGYLINSNYLVTEAVKEKLETILEEISQLTAIEMEGRYQEEHKIEVKTGQKSCAKSFIQLAHISKSWDYSFERQEGFPYQFNYEMRI